MGAQNVGICWSFKAIYAKRNCYKSIKCFSVHHHSNELKVNFTMKHISQRKWFSLSVLFSFNFYRSRFTIHNKTNGFFTPHAMSATGVGIGGGIFVDVFVLTGTVVAVLDRIALYGGGCVLV